MKFRALWTPPPPPPPAAPRPEPEIAGLREAPRLPVRVAILLIVLGGTLVVLLYGVALPGPLGTVRDYRLTRDYRDHAATALAVRKGVNQVWLGTDGGGVERYEHRLQRFLPVLDRAATGRRLHSDHIREVALGSKFGAILSGDDPAAGGSLQIAETARQVELWEQPLIGPGRFSGLSDESATAYAEPKNGTLSAVGTRDHGVGIYDWASRSWLGVLDQRNGLPSSAVSDLAWVHDPAAKESVLWVGTDEGLAGIAVSGEAAPVPKWWVTTEEGLPGRGIRELHTGAGFVWYRTDRNGVGRIKLAAAGQPEYEQAHEILVTAQPAGDLGDRDFRLAASPEAPGSTWFVGGAGASLVGRYLENPRDLQAIALPRAATPGSSPRLRVEPVEGRAALVVPGGPELFFAREDAAAAGGAKTPAGVRRLIARNRPGVVRAGVAGSFAGEIADAALWKDRAVVREGAALHLAPIGGDDAAWKWERVMGAGRFSELTAIGDIAGAVQHENKTYLAARAAGVGVWDRAQLELARFTPAPGTGEAASGPARRGALDLTLDAQGRLLLVGADHGLRAFDGEKWRALILARGAALDPARVTQTAASGRWFACAGGDQVALFDGQSLAWRDLPRLEGLRRLELSGAAVWAESGAGTLYVLANPWDNGSWEAKAHRVRDWSVSPERVAVLEDDEEGAATRLTLFAGADGKPLAALAPGAMPFGARDVHLAALSGRGTAAETVWLSDGRSVVAGYHLRRRAWQVMSTNGAVKFPLRALVGGEQAVWLLDAVGQLHAWSLGDNTLRPNLATGAVRIQPAPDRTLLAMLDGEKEARLLRFFEAPDSAPQVVIGRAFAGDLARVRAAALGEGLILAEGRHFAFYNWETHDFSNFEVAGEQIDALHVIGAQVWLVIDGRLHAWDPVAVKPAAVLAGDAPLGGMRSVARGEAGLLVLMNDGAVQRVAAAAPTAALPLIRPSSLPGYAGKLGPEQWAFLGAELFAATAQGVFSFHADRGLREGWRPVAGLAAGPVRRLWGSSDDLHLVIADEQSVAVAEPRGDGWEANERFRVGAAGVRISAVAVNASDIHVLATAGQPAGEVWRIGLGGNATQKLVGAAHPTRAGTAQVVADRGGDWIRLGGDGVVARYERATASWQREADFAAGTRLIAGEGVVMALAPGGKELQVRDPAARPGGPVWRAVPLGGVIAAAAAAGPGAAAWLEDGGVSWVGETGPPIAILAAGANGAFPRAFGRAAFALETRGSILIEDEATRLGLFNWTTQRWTGLPFTQGTLLGTTRELGPIVARNNGGRLELWNRPENASETGWAPMPKQPADVRRAWVGGGSLWHARGSILESWQGSEWLPRWGRTPEGGGLRGTAVSGMTVANGELLVTGKKAGRPFLLAIERRGVSRAVPVPAGAGALAPLPAGGFSTVVRDPAQGLSWGKIDGAGWQAQGRAPAGATSLVYDGKEAWAWDGSRLLRYEPSGWAVARDLAGLPVATGAAPRFVPAGESLWALVGDAVFRYRVENAAGRWEPIRLPSGGPGAGQLWFRNDELWLVDSAKKGPDSLQKLAADAGNFVSVPATPASRIVLSGAPPRVETSILGEKFEVEFTQGAALLRGAELMPDSESGVFRLRSTVSEAILRVALSLDRQGIAVCRALSIEAEGAIAGAGATPAAPAAAALASAMAGVLGIDARGVLVDSGTAWALDPRSGRILAYRAERTATPAALHRLPPPAMEFGDTAEFAGAWAVADTSGRAWRYSAQRGFSALLPGPFRVAALRALPEGLALFPAAANALPQLLDEEGRNTLDSRIVAGAGRAAWVSATRGLQPAWSAPASLNQPFLHAGVPLRFNAGAGRFNRDTFETIELVEDRIVLRGREASPAWQKQDDGTLTPAAAPVAVGAAPLITPIFAADSGFHAERSPGGPWVLEAGGEPLRITMGGGEKIELQPSTKGMGLTWEFPDAFGPASRDETLVAAEDGIHALGPAGARPAIVRRFAPPPFAGAVARVKADDAGLRVAAADGREYLWRDERWEAAGDRALAGTVLRGAVDLQDWRLPKTGRGLDRRGGGEQWVALEWNDAGFLFQQIAALSAERDFMAFTPGGVVRYERGVAIPAGISTDQAVPREASRGGFVTRVQDTQILVAPAAEKAAPKGWQRTAGPWEPAPAAWLVERLPVLDDRLAGAAEGLRWWKSSVAGGAEKIEAGDGNGTTRETTYVPAAGRFELDLCQSLGVAGGKPWLLTPAGVRGPDWHSLSPLEGLRVATGLEFASAFGSTDAALRDAAGRARFEWSGARWEPAENRPGPSPRSRGNIWTIEAAGGVVRHFAGRQTPDVPVALDEQGVWAFLHATAVAGETGVSLVAAGAQLLEIAGDGRLAGIRTVAAGDRILALARDEVSRVMEALTERGNRWEWRSSEWSPGTRRWDGKLPARREESRHWRVMHDANAIAMAYRAEPSAAFQPLQVRGPRLDFDDITEAMPLDAASCLALARGRATRRAWTGGAFEFDESHRPNHAWFQLAGSGEPWRSFRTDGGGRVEAWGGQWQPLDASAAADRLQRRESRTEQGATWTLARRNGNDLQFLRTAEAGRTEVALINPGRFDFDAFLSVQVAGDAVAIGTHHGLEMTTLVNASGEGTERATRWFPLELFGGRRNEAMQALHREPGGADLLVRSPETVWSFGLERRTFSAAPAGAWDEALASRARDDRGWTIRTTSGRAAAGWEVAWRNQPTFLIAGEDQSCQFAHALAHSALAGEQGIALGTQAGLVDLRLDEAGNIADAALRTAAFRRYWPEAPLAWLERSADGAMLAAIAPPRAAPIWFRLGANDPEPRPVSASQMEATVRPRSADDILRFTRRADGRLDVTYAENLASPATLRPFVQRGTFAFLDLADGLDAGGRGTVAATGSGVFWTTAAGVMQFDPRERRFTALFGGPDERDKDAFVRPLRLSPGVQPRGLIAENDRTTHLFDAANRLWTPAAQHSPALDRELVSSSPLLEWRVQGGGVRPLLRATDRPAAPIFRAGLAEIDRISALAVDRAPVDGDRALLLTAAGAARHSAETFELKALAAMAFQNAMEPATGALPPGQAGLVPLPSGAVRGVIDLNAAGVYAAAAQDDRWEKIAPDAAERMALRRQLETEAEQSGRWRWSRDAGGLAVEILPPFVNGPRAAILGLGQADHIGPAFGRGTFAWVDPVSMNWTSTDKLLVLTPVGVTRFELDSDRRTGGLKGLDVWAESVAGGSPGAETAGPMHGPKAIFSGLEKEILLVGQEGNFALDAPDGRRWVATAERAPFTPQRAEFRADGRGWSIVPDAASGVVRVQWSRRFHSTWHAPIAAVPVRHEGMRGLGVSDAGIWFVANGEFFLMSRAHVNQHLPFSW